MAQLVEVDNSFQEQGLLSAPRPRSRGDPSSTATANNDYGNVTQNSGHKRMSEKNQELALEASDPANIPVSTNHLF